jgi:predicted NUDIX family phosphoesterase
VYCPECGIEYREGFTECFDCHVPLEAGSPPREDAEFDPSMDLVVVLETNDRVQLALAKGVLEEAGIPYYVLGQIAGLVNDVDGFTRKWSRLQVARDREMEARELLEQMLRPVPGGDATEEGSGQ